MSFKSKAKINLKPILKLSLKISGIIFSITGGILSFISINEITWLKDIKIRIIVLFGLAFLSFCISIVSYVFFRNKEIIWEKGSNRIVAMYGDLFEISNNNENKIIVIPVNDTFETIVDKGCVVEKPLVSPDTIHGKWLNHVVNASYSQKELNDEIQEMLKGKYFHQLDKERGNDKSFNIGTIATIESRDNPNTIYCLLVISKFDENNNAITSIEDIKLSIENLIDFYSKRNQGSKLYVPLIGTNKARINLESQDAYDLMKFAMLSNKEKINGNINIIIYKDDRDKVSIFE